VTDKIWRRNKGLQAHQLHY